MKNDIRKSVTVHCADENAACLFDDWFDPIEAGLRERVRGFIARPSDMRLPSGRPRRR